MGFSAACSTLPTLEALTMRSRQETAGIAATFSRHDDPRFYEPLNRLLELLSESSTYTYSIRV